MNVFAGVDGWAAGWLPGGCWMDCRADVCLLGGRFPSVALAPPAALGN